MSMGARDTYPTVGGGRPVWAPWGQNPMGTSRVDAYRVLRAEPNATGNFARCYITGATPRGGGVSGGPHSLNYARSLHRAAAILQRSVLITHNHKAMQS